MSNKNLKKAIDDQISKGPLFTEEDRRRFYSHTQKKRSSWWNQGFPRLLTVMTTLLVLAGSFYFFTSGNPFQAPASPDQETVIDKPMPEEEEKEKEEPPTLEEKIEQIKGMIHTEEPANKEQMTEIVQALNGKQVSVTEDEQGERISFVFSPNEKMLETSYTEAPSLEAFQNGDLDLFAVLQLAEEYDMVYSAELTYLSEDGESLTKEKSGSGASQRQFEKVVGAEEPVSMKDLTLRSIARSLDKEPEALTKGDLLDLEELTINASHLNGIYDVEAAPEYFKAMKSLKVLKLNQAMIPVELLKEVPTIEQVKFIGPTVKDLSSVADGLQNVQYLNLINSSFDGTAEDLLKLKSLTIVRVSPSVVPDYEKLQFEGIDVRW
ncbi:hypothetical protein [Halobacillus salinus]|uniref:Leucine-rich repeat domain-containing protein n=1 Tax=Halobacillus salinus TaxID=192814 RepID=A0A4Z0H3A2_9BACI|nr:hypothetical protein [Halobacillus salinus]TGB03655.1 hypothetical protein E4663_01230 [Halobacillus salinus]